MAEYSPTRAAPLGRIKLRPTMKDGKTPRCRASVSSGWWDHQCNNSAKFDDNTRCKRHSDATAAEKKRVNDEKYRRWVAEVTYRRDTQVWEERCEAAIQAIAEGHNDPCELCQTLLAEKPEKPDWLE